MEGVVFQPVEPDNTAEVRVDCAKPQPADAHFFVAVCAHRPQTGTPTFVYVPRTGNVLRERELHIRLLESELQQKNEWLEKAKNDLAALNQQHQKLLEMFREQKEELETRTEWVQALKLRLAEADEQLARVSRRAAADWRTTTKLRWESSKKRTGGRPSGPLKPRNAWAWSWKRSRRSWSSAVEVLHDTERHLAERTAWAQRLQGEAARLQDQLSLVRASRWMTVGTQAGRGAGPAGCVTWRP